MSRVYARFAAVPIGPLLVARDSGLTLTTDSDDADLQRHARSNVGHESGSHGAEFTFWGDATLQAAIGPVTSMAALGAMVGNDANGVGWRLDTGEVFIGGVSVANGLPVVEKGDTVGLRIWLDEGSPSVTFYLGNDLVHSHTLPASSSPWHFGASLAAAEAGTMVCAVNAGQWQGVSPAVREAGWRPSNVSVDPVRLADWDWLSSPTDTPANARFEGLIESASLQTIAELGFWCWGGDAPMQGGAAQLTLLDADGVLDDLAAGDITDVPVAIRNVDRNGSLSTSAPVARYVAERIEVNSDARKTLHLRSAHDALDEPIARGQFLPSIPQLAWKTQPAVIGAVASVPALAANSDGAVAWLADAPLASVTAVLDRGDAMEGGTWSLASDGQQLLLNQPPVGPVVVDASSIGAAQQPATLQQALYEIFRRVDEAAWSSVDAGAIDIATGYAGIGYYAGDQVTARQALAAILPSYGAWWWEDAEGLLRISRVIDPATVSIGDLAFDIDQADLATDLERVPDEAPGLTRRMAYRPNARPLAASDLVTDLVDVPQWRRDELTSAWRGQVYSGKALAPRYAHADTAAPFVSVFWREDDAQAEIDRVCSLYALARSFWVCRLQGAFELDVNPGQVGRLTYPRFGLTAGRQLLVRRVERNPATGEVALTLWG